jgi:nitrite reductase/ring-hydroxylating ferredoxin subunit
MTLISFLIDCLRRFSPSLSQSLPHIATYTRELPVSLERMYENAIDGEHLPWLHSSSFSHIQILEQGDWGWRAKANLTPKSWFNSMHLELRLDRDKNRWITRTLGGLGMGTEIWTHAIPMGKVQIKVIVDFYVPKLPRFLHGFYRKQFLNTYCNLYDEDVWMMVTRQNQLDRVSAGKSKQTNAPMDLGSQSHIKQSLPFKFDFNNHSYQLIELAGKWIAHSRVCPHLLGPLDNPEFSADGMRASVQCPWHGYRFDVATRNCTSGALCRLAPAPKLYHDQESDKLWAQFE